MEIIGDLVSRALLGLSDDGDKEKILRHITLGRGLIKGGARHGG
jgi:hypothetical protein